MSRCSRSPSSRRRWRRSRCLGGGASRPDARVPSAGRRGTSPTCALLLLPVLFYRVHLRLGPPSAGSSTGYDNARVQDGHLSLSLSLSLSPSYAIRRSAWSGRRLRKQRQHLVSWPRSRRRWRWRWARGGDTLCTDQRRRLPRPRPRLRRRRRAAAGEDLGAVEPRVGAVRLGAPRRCSASRSTTPRWSISSATARSRRLLRSAVAAQRAAHPLAAAAEPSPPGVPAAEPPCLCDWMPNNGFDGFASGTAVVSLAAPSSSSSPPPSVSARRSRRPTEPSGSTLGRTLVAAGVAQRPCVRRQRLRRVWRCKLFMSSAPWPLGPRWGKWT